MPTDDVLAEAGLQLHLADVVATITLDRPEARNAQTPLMWRTLARVGEHLPETIRVVVVRGAGHAFSAGLDRSLLAPAAADGPESVGDLLAMDDAEVSATIDAYQRGFVWLHDPRFVSIAAVHGYAIGAGFQLALACDLIVAADDSYLCMRETELGLVPDLAGTHPLVQRVGYSRALEICVTARKVPAVEAAAIGLVHSAVPSAELASRVADLVAAVTAPLPGAVRETTALIASATRVDLDEQRRLEREAQTRRFRELAGGA